MVCPRGQHLSYYYASHTLYYLALCDFWLFYSLIGVTFLSPVSESKDIFAGLRVATCIFTTHQEPDVSPCQIWAFPYAKPSLMQDVTFEIEHFDLAATFSIELTLD